MNRIIFPDGSSSVSWPSYLFEVLAHGSVLQGGTLTLYIDGPNSLEVMGNDMAFSETGDLIGGTIDNVLLNVAGQAAIIVEFDPPLAAAAFQPLIDAARDGLVSVSALALSLLAMAGPINIEATSATQFDVLSFADASITGDGLNVVLDGSGGGGTATGIWAGIATVAAFAGQEAVIGTQGADRFAISPGFSNTDLAQRGFADARGAGLLFAWTGGAGDDVFNGGAAARLILIDYAAEGALHPALARGVTVNLTGAAMGILGAGKARDTFGHIDTIAGVTSFRLAGTADFFAAGAAAVYVAGGAGADRLTGSTGADELHGEAGNDTLDGRTGADRLVGDAGDDTYFANIAGDRVEEAEGGGFDVVNYSGTGTYVLGVNVEKLNLVGTTAANATGNALANTISGNNLANTLSGMAGADTMSGGLGNDLYIADKLTDRVIEAAGAAAGTDTVRYTGNSGTLALGTNIENLVLYGTAATAGKGNATANVLSGNVASNTLDGGLGSDTLTGGAGKDFFLFCTKLGLSNIDRITDYNVVDDTFRIDDAVFTKVGPGKALSRDQLWKSADGQAHDTTDRIIYETDTGKLFYDADGTGAGKAIQFALLAKNLLLTHTDFLIV